MKRNAIRFIVIAALLIGIYSCNARVESPGEGGTKLGLGTSYGTTIKHVPSNLPSSSVPLVIAIHGCSQSASDYEAATGWSDLADNISLLSHILIK